MSFKPQQQTTSEHTKTHRLIGLKLAIGSLIVGTALTASSLALAKGDDYPAKPVEMIVPWSPGGGSDTLMRVVSNYAEPYLGQPMPVINMPGVSGTTGLEQPT